MNKKLIMSFLRVFVISFVAIQILNILKKDSIKPGVTEMTYPLLLESIKADKVKKDSIIINKDNQTISGEIKEDFVKEFKESKFSIYGDVGDEGIKELKSNGIVPKFKRPSPWLQVLSFLPIMLLFGLIGYSVLRQQSSLKLNKQFDLDVNTGVTFKDVAGITDVKEDLQEVISFLKNPQKYQSQGCSIPKGVLLEGPPGTGKTLIAKATAGEAGVPFMAISGSEFVEKYVGVGASRVREVFNSAKKHPACIVFIDEIDAVGGARGQDGNSEREQTLNQLLVEMDGFDSKTKIIVIAATNRSQTLDQALLRPGRFDRRITVGNPDLSDREEILKVHVRKKSLSKDVDLNKVARGTPGFSGADLKNLINESALLAIKEDKKEIDMELIETAKDKIIMGSERRSLMLSDHDKKVTAYHEAGHTLVSVLCPNLDPIHKVSIVPRGRALGVTMTLPKGDSVSITKSQIENQIAMLFGGRAAEEIVFGDITTGAGNDIQRASHLARMMVTQWGMSEKLGPLDLTNSDGKVSDLKSLEVDKEVDSIIQNAYVKATTIIKKNMQALEDITKALIDKETISGKDVSDIMQALQTVS